MRSLSPLLACICLLCAGGPTGCYVPNKMYRPPQRSLVQVLPAPPLPAKHPAPDGPKCTASSLQTRPCLAFLEFDDMGEKWNQSSQPISDGDAIDDASQLSNAVKIVRVAAKQDPHALIITFIHGWKHNARPDDSNIEGFKQVLNYLFETKYYDQHQQRHHAVVGVFISWRGNLVSEHWPVRQQFTYFNREATAARIPGPSLTDALLAITSAAHENNDAQHHPLVVLVGHSFGGLLLERGFAQATVDEIKMQTQPFKQSDAQVTQSSEALQQSMNGLTVDSATVATIKTQTDTLHATLARTPSGAQEQQRQLDDARALAGNLEQTRSEVPAANSSAIETSVARAHDVVNALEQRQRSAFTPPADLVIFINSAAAATEAKETLDFLASDHFTYSVSGKRAPLFLSVSSSADAATKFAMPIGHGLPFLRYKTKGSFRAGASKGGNQPDGYQLSCFDPSSNKSSFFSPAPTQGAFFMSTAAHMEILQSHLLVEEKDPAKRESCSLADFPDPSVIQAYKMRDAARCFKVEERAGRCNGTPYWLMEIDPSIVPDHGTIFTGRFLDFLTLFIPNREELEGNVRPTLSMQK